MEGLLAGRALWVDLPSAYQGGENLPLPGNIAVYSERDDEDFSMKLWSARSFAELIGRATTCEELSKRVFMIAGECHYRGGPVILVSEATFNSNEPQRFVGEAARRRYGNLTRLPVGPADGRIASTASAFFDALRNRDATTLDGVRRTWRLDWTGDMMLDPKVSPFKGLFGMPRALPIAYFQSEIDDDGSHSPVIWACACREGNCDEVWPIHTADADVYDPWPYFCISFHKDGRIWFD